MQADVPFDGFIQTTAIRGLELLTCGKSPPNPAELLGSGKMVAILEEAKKKADLLVIDSPPLMAVSDAAILACRVDGVLLVVKPGSTKMAAFQHAVEQLRRSGANLLGVAFSEVDMKRSPYSDYYGYYQIYEPEQGDRSNGRRHKTGPRWNLPWEKAAPVNPPDEQVR